ncbi:MAG: 4Fe-4S dicluster domain-containing protein [Bacteroidota bacterium]|nr:4Fe-4S dicluster domain-containing protein [Bacteroidota bacterium]
MMDFGFGLSPSSAVNLDTVDLDLFRKVEARCPDIRTCIGCGSCSATCMASAWSGMSVRQVILALQRGQLKQVEQKLSACMLCGKCTMVCPRGINTRNLILAVSREYKKEGTV